MSQSINEQELIKKIDDLEKDKLLTFSPYRAMVSVWMLAIALASAGFIWYGIATWDDPAQSILSIGMGIWLIFLAVSRIVRKEIEVNGSSKE
jgi:tellurite resistance protein TehA-like permease